MWLWIWFFATILAWGAFWVIWHKLDYEGECGFFVPVGLIINTVFLYIYYFNFLIRN